MWMASGKSTVINEPTCHVYVWNKPDIKDTSIKYFHLHKKFAAIPDLFISVSRDNAFNIGDMNIDYM